MEGDQYNASEDEFSINFKSGNKRRKFKSILRVVTFVLIAAISGGISGTYIVNRRISQKLSEINKSSENSSVLSLSKANTAASDTQKNYANKVADIVGPAVVGISNKDKNNNANFNNNSGSGLIFNKNGYIVTKNHIIKNDSSIVVRLSSGKIMDAKVIGKDTKSDLAVIKIDAENLPTVKFGDSSKVKVGDLAICIGNPLGEELEVTVTAGIISAVNRKMKLGEEGYKGIETDAVINSGNIGGALCNEYGEVIGINSLRINNRENIEGMGFAIAINEVKDIADSLMNYGHVSRPGIGIKGRSVNAEQIGTKGIYVQEVIKDTGAYKADIKPTDIIIEVDNKKVTKFEDLNNVMNGHKVGDMVSCKIWRNGRTKMINVIVSDIKK